jgi:hypothetical protein
MPLQFVDQPAEPKLNILLYSGPGTGKTTGALSAPGPILYLNAEGPNAAMFARQLHPVGHVREVTVTGADTLREATLHLRAGHDFATVVVDSLGAVFQTVLEDMTHGGKPTLPQYGDTTTILERFCRELRDLPVNVVLVAHEIPVKDEETGILERLPFTGTSNPQLGVKLIAQMDIAGYCGRSAPAEDGGKPRYLAQLFNGGGRRGKDRTAVLGDSRPLDLSEWIDTYNRAISPANPARREKETVPA